MIYLFHDKAGSATLILEGEDHKHMIKARRHEVGETLLLRPNNEEVFYHYRIESISKKDALLRLEKSEAIPTEGFKKLHIGWSLIDPKSIEKALPSLCEIGVTQITFLITKRSQHHFRLDDKRIKRIIQNAMQQSGRLYTMEIHYDVSLERFVTEHPKALVLDFCEEGLRDDETFSTVILGPEGGFSKEDKDLLKDLTFRRFNTGNILRSETAAIAVASKLLL